MTKEVVDTMLEKMNKSVAVYKKELTSMRAGRANPQLLDRILVDYYGTPTPINQVANVSIPDPRIIQIAPLGAEHAQGHREGDPEVRPGDQSL